MISMLRRAGSGLRLSEEDMTTKDFMSVVK